MQGLLALVALAFYACQPSVSTVVGKGVQARASPDCGNSSDAITLLRAVCRIVDAGKNNARSFLRRKHAGGVSLRAAVVFFDPLFHQRRICGIQVCRAACPDADNIYTSDSDEIATLVAEGWTDIGVYWYAYTSQICGSVPFYVVDNPTTTDHIYTTNITERDTLVSDSGYVDEGIAMYVLPFTG